VIKIWSDIAWKGYCQFFEKNQKNLIKSTHDLIKDIERNGTDKGKGQPESLKHELSGYWSRRIDKENRLVYKVEEEKLYIVQCGTHYKQ
jgi:toxin YoeB